MIIPILVIILVIIAAVIYALAPHPPRTPASVESISELEEYFKRLVKTGSPPGLSIAVVKDGNLIYKKAFGYADGPRKAKATFDTVYHWWSMTKIPTALAVMKLQEQGRLKLNDEVIKYLPWFEVDYSSVKGQRITIGNLMQHSSGLPDTIPAMIGWVHYDDTTRNQTEIVKKHLNEFNTLKFDPGMKAAYSNFNYMVLGSIIESITGQTYESYIIENILKPLGMERTNFVYIPEMDKYEASGTLPVVHPFTLMLPFLLNTKKLVNQRQGKLLWLNKVYIDATPSTGLIGPAKDVSRLMLAYLNSGILEGVEILSSRSISAMNETPPIDGRGLGWVINDEQKPLFVEHSGGGPGFATIMRLYPESKLGIVILANGTDLDRHGIVNLMTKLDW
jgi:D-alanyl-D-alanine carboxypeptidase